MSLNLVPRAFLYVVSAVGLGSEELETRLCVTLSSSLCGVFQHLRLMWKYMISVAHISGADKDLKKEMKDVLKFEANLAMVNSRFIGHSGVI